MIEVETQTVDVDVVTGIDAESTGTVDVAPVALDDLAITVAKKEYVITGDDIYIPVLYDDAPQWMKDLVSLTVDVSIETANTATLNQLTQMLSEFATSYVPLNQYTQSILDLSDADESMHALITTLNSNFNDGLSEANSQIIHLESTKASRTEVVAQVVDTIAAQLATPGSDIQSVIARLDQAIVTETQARAQSFQVLTSSLNNVGSDVTANASAIHSLNTYVGVSNGAPNGSGALADIVILQKQNDGVIETVTGTYDVMLNPQDPNLAELVLTAEPYASWRAADVTGIDTRLKHIGDVYIKYTVTSNGAREYIGSYKFIRTVVDVTDAHHSTDADGFTWALIVDQAAQDAYNQALNAYDLADNKRRVFTTTPYGPYDIGDLWTKTVSGGSTLYKATVKRVSGYVAGDWVVADDAGLNTFVSTTYVPTVTSLQNQVDGKVESWYTLSTSDPKVAWTDAATRLKHDGDLWYQTDTKLSYWYSSSTNAWNPIYDADAKQALADAATAQATADGKINSYYVATLADAQTMGNGWTATEKTNNTGDLVVVWNDSTLDNNGTWRWNGTSWVTTRDKKLVSLASDVTTLRTDLNSGTGTWVTGDTQVTNNLTAVIEDTKATIESQWKYNSNLTLDGITYSTGFGLATSLTNGSGLPVGDSEFWIKADKFKLMSADGSRKSAYSPFTVDTNTGNITFNGIVSFSNVTGTDNLALKDMSNVTTIDGGKITTNQAFVNNLNATGGVVAETISANEIVGKTFTGSIINGAVINGSVIRVSYLDLDRDLKVLTDYHITPAMYNANPSLYTDAVYMSGTNEHRIPSISLIKEESKTKNINVVGNTFNSKIRSYNCANVGHNIKAVKIRPYIQTNPHDFFTIRYSYYNPQYSDPNIYSGRTDSFEIYFAGFSLGVFYYVFPLKSGEYDDWYYYGGGLYRNGSLVSLNIDNYSFSLNSYNFMVSITENQGILSRNGFFEIKFSLTNTQGFSKYLDVDFSDTSIGFIDIANKGGSTASFSHSGYATLTYTAIAETNMNNISINNMI